MSNNETSNNDPSRGNLSATAVFLPKLLAKQTNPANSAETRSPAMEQQQANHHIVETGSTSANTEKQRFTSASSSSSDKKQPKEISRQEEVRQFNLTVDINPMHDVEKQQEKLSIVKANMPLIRLVFLGILAGWWLGLGVCLVVTMAGGIPVDVRTDWPMLPKLVTGFLFPVGICFISMFGGELFTGNSMSMLIGLWAGRVTLFELLFNWIVVLVTNFIGATGTVYFFGYLTQLHSEDPYLSYIQGVAVTKINLPPAVAFLRAIACNALVCTCLLLGMSARDMFGKLVS